METQKISIPASFEFLKEPARYKVAWGGRGSAKSWSFATMLILKAISENHRILCGREIQNSIKDSVKKVIEDNLNIDNVFNIGCSLWSKEKLSYIKSLSNNAKNGKFAKRSELSSSK